MSLLKNSWFRKVISGCIHVGIAVAALSCDAQAQSSSLKVACLGDSITAGYGLPATDAYPIKLQSSLGSRFSVQNYGVSGLTAMLQSRNPEGGSYWASGAYQNARNSAPNIVVLKLGSNDAKTTNDTQRGPNHMNFVSDVEAAIDELHSLPSRPDVFLCTPFYAKGNGFDISANTLNTAIAPLLRKIADRKNCTLIDLHALQSGNNTFYQSGDNIHPNAAGTTLISNEVARVLNHHYGQKLLAFPYVNSWVGNSFGTPAGHIPHNFDNIYVTPSGKVATITGWEEGGANVALYGPTGVKLGIPWESGTGSWGRMSGSAVFIDDNYVYQSFSQAGGYGADGQMFPVDPNTKWKGIRRYNHDGSYAPFSGGKAFGDNMLVVQQDASDSKPTGVLVYNSELYVADPIAGQIKVYNATTMAQTPVRSFAKPNVGLMDYDRLGFIWMLDAVQRKLIRFSATGTTQAQSITFPTGVTPTSFCVDKVNDRILVTNNGNDQNVLIYTGIFTNPAQTASFGTTGGINSGVTGVIAPLKFSEPKGVGIDSAGNIFVANNGVSYGGGRLEKYNSSGVLQWRHSGFIFTATGSLNPSDETELYSPEGRFSLNLNNTTPGTEWSSASTAMTLNKVKYPDDARIPAPGDGHIWATPYVRIVSGKKLLFVQDMNGSQLQIFRFNAATDGETAIPSAHFKSTSIWRDANGNGAKDAIELVTKPQDSHTGGYFPDANGGIWHAVPSAFSGRIRHYPLQGFDSMGNPQYSVATSINYDQTELYEVRNLEYDAATDVLYAIGRSSNTVPDAWLGDRMVRFNNFSNNSSRAVAWSISIPFSNNGSPATDTNVKAFSSAGDYLFMAAARNGRIYVHTKSDGLKVGEILPTAATGNKSGWFDIWGAVHAVKRANGEYLIFAEENGFAKINMYRWRPSGSFPYTGGDTFLFNGNTAEWLPRNTLPATYDLSFATSVQVNRVVLWMPSDWGGPVSMTAEIRGGTTSTVTTTIIGPTVYSISGSVPVTITFPATALQHLRVVITATHNGTGNLSEVEVYPVTAHSITSPLTRAATVGTALSNYIITASNSPTSYNATNLPVGLSVDTTTGVISGNPTTAGSVSTIISATGAAGTVSDILVFTIAATAIPNYQLIPTNGDAFLYNGNTAEWVPRNSLPATYDLSFATSVSVNRVVLWMPSGWGGPVNMTAEIRGGANSANTTTIVAPKIYSISGAVPVSISFPAVALQHLRIIITATHNNEGNLSEAEVYRPTTAMLPSVSFIVSGNSATVTTPTSVTGFNYSLFYSDSLQAGSWLPLAGNPKAGGGVLNWTNDITSVTRRFYRMAVE